MGDTTSLVSAWLLQTDGTTTPDAFGANTLNENGSVVSTTGGPFGNWDLFDAGTDFWSITDAAQTGLDITSSMSITAIVQQVNFASGKKVICGKQTGAYSFYLGDGTGDSAGAMRARFNTTQATGSTGTLSLDTETGVAVVLDTVNDTVKYYKNGSLDTTITSYTAVPTDTANAFNVGAGDSAFLNWGNNTGNNFIAEVMIFSRTLADAEVLDIYTNGIANFLGGGGATADFQKLTLMGVG